ncbi:MAG TPA: acyl-CoA desaturase [Dongiaceae bacterium]|nr:acyl-CoA desaturase [Dongiaceae bacterium]
MNISAMQKRHFILLDVLPLLGTLLGVVVLTQTGVHAIDLVGLILMWFVTVVGIELGYHRYFSHQAFQVRPWVKGMLVVFASMGGQGSVIAWATNHVHHHRFSDQKEDTHTPMQSGDGVWGRLKGFLHAQLLWKWSYRPPLPDRQALWLYKDPMITRLSKNRSYFSWVLLGLLLPAAISGLWEMSWEGALRGFLLGGVIRLFATQQGTFLINSLCHLVGAQPYTSKDNSRNAAGFSLVTLGGAWHNNHHAFPRSGKNSHDWWQIDYGYGVLRVAERLGWVWDIHTVSQEDRRRKLKTAGVTTESITGVITKTQAAGNSGGGTYDSNAAGS